MRLCQDCRWLKGRDCKAPQNAQTGTVIDYVTGERRVPDPIYFGAQFCRSDRTTCGPDAAWFELKIVQQAPRPAEAATELGSA